MKLIKLIDRLEIKCPKSLKQEKITITGIELDSRKIKPGNLFIAQKGYITDGNNYIIQAINNGASAILTSNLEIANKCGYLYSSAIDEILPKLLSKFYNKKPNLIIAITGTSGKTSSAYFAYQIACNLGLKAGYIGTIGVIAKDNEISIANNLTSPDIVTMHQILHEMAEKNIEFVALEASSHGIILGRLEGIRFNCASFTNLSKEHLDFHLNMEEYFKAKFKLFEKLLPHNASMVINRNLNHYDQLANLAKNKKCRLISYGSSEADLNITKFSPNPKGIKAELNILGQTLIKSFNFIGSFQLDNLLCAIANFLSLGIEISRIEKAINNIVPPIGRMQLITKDNYPSVIVDYAHKPVALEKALIAAREHLGNKNKLWVVFGCGGDRDKTKRKDMGEIADKLADYIIITDDNPRNENPDLIRQEIFSGCSKANIIPDRSQAIEYATKNAGKNDIILIAGKGHENYQIIGNQKIEFSDIECVKKLLELF